LIRAAAQDRTPPSDRPPHGGEVHADAGSATYTSYPCKLDPFKPAISQLLERDATAPATVIAEHLRTLGFEGGITIVKDYLQALCTEARNRRAYVRMEPGPGERFEVDWGTLRRACL